MNALRLPEADLDLILRGAVPHWEALRNEHILLVGGTGFVGKWLLGSFVHANRSLGLNARMTVLSRDVAATLARHPSLQDLPEVDWIHGDLRHFEWAGRARYAIHAATDVVASISACQQFDTCVQGTRQLLSQLHGSERLLLLSSGAVYGANLPEYTPEHHPGAPDSLLASSAYGLGKRAAEHLCALAAADTGLIVPVARCFAFVGPHLALDKQFAVGNFIQAALHEQPIIIQGDGQARRSYLYAAELTQWLWHLLFRGQSARAYNVGGAESLSILELAQRVVASLGARSSIEVRQAPGPTVSHYVPDLGRIKNELGLTPQVSLEQALQKTATWHQHP